MALIIVRQVRFKYGVALYNAKVVQTKTHAVLRHVKILAKTNYGNAFISAFVVEQTLTRSYCWLSSNVPVARIVYVYRVIRRGLLA